MRIFLRTTFLRKMNPKMKSKTVVYLTKDKGSAALKRAAIADYFGEGEIGVLDSGKPVIVKPEGYHISVSHSGEIVGVVISNVPIGLDIEEVKDIDYSRIKEKFLSEKESEEASSLSSFFNVWVRKEAESKISGKGVFSLRKKDTSANIVYISKEVSSFSGVKMSACLASFSSITYTIREI